jgi:hypothetical protein
MHRRYAPDDICTADSQPHNRPYRRVGETLCFKYYRRRHRERVDENDILDGRQTAVREYRWCYPRDNKCFHLLTPSDPFGSCTLPFLTAVCPR